MSPNPFYGRSLNAVGDFNRYERLYLYGKTRALKGALAVTAREGAEANRGDTAAREMVETDRGRAAAREMVESFRIADPDFGMYEIFLEDSTRTRESFKNAALFHRIKFSELHAETSSFNKKESYADTIANLIGYDNRVFVLRTPLEGVCRHLAQETEKYRRRNNVTAGVSFINAGDGRHEHPTQELLDEFTFLEDLEWSHDSIHLAMVGDLYNGRTVHSKVHGLDLFSSVAVDLIAPPELAMPAGYVRVMQNKGFRVRTFTSIREYLESGDVANQWYFTRPQLERMGERVLRRQDELREAITFTHDLIPSVSRETRFYHPLPRHREFPTIPRSLDETHLNGWERQSANGYLVRIVLLAMVAGKIGQDYDGPVGAAAPKEEGCIREVPPKDRTEGGKGRHYSEGIRPIQNGIVIDHICVGEDPAAIRSHMGTIQSVARLDGRGGEWVSTGSDGRPKGLLFRPDYGEPSDRTLEAIAAVVPGGTVNIVRDGSVRRKLRLIRPRRIADIPGLRCRNETCITNPDHGEHILPSFTASDRDRYECEYCSTDHDFREIWT